MPSKESRPFDGKNFSRICNSFKFLIFMGTVCFFISTVKQISKNWLYQEFDLDDTKYEKNIKVLMNKEENFISVFYEKDNKENYCIIYKNYDPNNFYGNTELCNFEKK